MILKTKRLLLRHFKDADLESLYNYRNNSKCAKYQRWEKTSLEDLGDFIKKEKIKKFPLNNIQLAVASKETDELIGDIYIAFKKNTITLGYTIAPEHQRKGYAYEMLKSLINYLLNKFNEFEIVCMVHPDNKPSKQLLKKLNFKNEGYFKEVDSLIYSLTNLCNLR